MLQGLSNILIFVLTNVFARALATTIMVVAVYAYPFVLPRLLSRYLALPARCERSSNSAPTPNGLVTSISSSAFSLPTTNKQRLCEGGYLEPDKSDGYAYRNALRKALENNNEWPVDYSADR